MHKSSDDIRVTLYREHVIITKNAAELVEELLLAIRENNGTPWFIIIERKMKRLAEQLRQ